MTVDKDIKNLFIIGSRRSGTTWTLSLMANHPQMVGVLHTSLIEAFVALQEWRRDSVPFRNQIVGAEGEKATLQQFFTDEEFYDICRNIPNTILAKALQKKPQARVIVESQPENIDHLELLTSLYPNAYILHVIRDPRSVFASWKTGASTWSSADVFNTHPQGFGNRWRQDIDNARKVADRLPHYKEVRYEELKSNGVEILSDIFDWLGVDDDKAIATASIEACKIEKLREKSLMPDGFFRKGQSEGWRSDLTTNEVSSVEYLLQDMMDELNYQRVNQGKLNTPAFLKRYYFMRACYRNLMKLSPLYQLKSFKRRRVGGV